MLASSYLFVSFARMAMSDMLLTFCVTAAFACFISALTERTPRSRKLVFVGYVALALGVLTKGPVALALVAIPIGLELIVRRDRASFKRLRILPGLGLFLVIAAPYFFLVFVRVGLGPLRFFFVGENLQRFSGQIYESGARPFWYELAAFFSDFAPWSLLLFLAAWFDWRRTERERTSRSVTRVLYLWLVYTVILFSLASFKRDYYLLPAMPAAALIIGPLIANAERLPKFARRIVAGFLVICGVGLLAGALLSLRAAVLLSVQTSLRFLPPVIALVGLVLVFTGIMRWKIWQASLILAATIWATILSMQLILLPAFLRYQPTPQLAASIPAGSVVYISRAADEWANSLAFNLPSSHLIERISVDPNDTRLDDQKLLAALGSDRQAVAVIWEHEYARLVEGDPALKIIARVETYGHGGLSLNLIRHPVRQHLYLVGHDH
jgi:4-amino-4-deoxy-L-arabinose transferase-like glycosyltransferase